MRIGQSLGILGVLAAASAAAILLVGDRGRSLRLGPLDGAELPPIQLDRVAIGSTAPDFRLRALDGSTVALSEYRGAKNVVLVFYRGHW